MGRNPKRHARQVLEPEEGKQPRVAGQQNEPILRPSMEQGIYEVFGRDPAARPAEINDWLAAIDEARSIITNDPQVNSPVPWKGRESVEHRHPLGTIGRPMEADPSTVQALAEVLAPYTEHGRRTIFPEMRRSHHLRGVEAILAPVDTRPTHVYLLTPSAVGCGSGRSMDLIENAACNASSVLLAAHSFMSVARNAWHLTKAPKAGLKKHERMFWKTANKLVEGVTAPAGLLVQMGRRVVDEMVRIIRLRHPALRQEDRLKIALHLGQNVGLEKDGHSESLAARYLWRKNHPM